ncbi:hypothetical protein COCCADRAFT_89196, partial [Bipolaris zeicola 26-R-13]
QDSPNPSQPRRTLAPRIIKTAVPWYGLALHQNPRRQCLTCGTRPGKCSSIHPSWLLPRKVCPG